MNFRKRGKQILSFCLACVLTFTALPLDTIVHAEDYNNVVVSVQNKAYVDVLLSRGKTRANTDNFETDLKNALSQEGVSTQYVNFIKNDSVKMVGQTGFNKYTWTFNSTRGNTMNTGWSGIGRYYFSGQDLCMQGNPSNGGSMRYSTTMQENAYKYTMDFDYSADFGDNFYGAIVFLGCTLDTGRGVCIYIGRNYGSYSSGVYYNSMVYSNGSFSLGTSTNINIPTSGHISISALNGEYTINGVTVPGTYDGRDWGFTTDQYSHGCSSIGFFSYKNLEVNIETSKEFKKVLTEEQNNWTTGYTHIMVDCIDEDTESSFRREDTNYYDVLNLLNISDIHMIGWGTGANASTLQNYIRLLPNGGTFVDMGAYDANTKQVTNYWDCIAATAKYIADLIRQSMNEDIVIIDNPTDITVSPNGARNLSKWSFEHDITQLSNGLTLDNNLGYSDYQGQTNITFPSGFQFDKPGVYYIKYNGQLVKKITAHRKPTAITNYVGRTQISGSNFNYSFSSQSFDIDSNDNIYGLGKGVQSLTWRYRVDGGNWISAGNGINATIPLDTDKNTDIQLTVTDFLGATDTTTRTINASTKPVAFFAFSNNPISLYEPISVIDSSYDALGRTITAREWVLKNKDGGVIWQGTTAPTFTPASMGMGIGDYTLSLTVTNEKGTKSYTYTSGLTVKKVVANALYDYNWTNSYHNDYPGSVQVEYLSKYPTLQTPSKFYRVNFDANTGTEVGKNYEDSYSTFDGWFLKENLTDKITPNVTQVKETGNHKIYAKWIYNSITLPTAKKIYTVTYNPNGTAIDKATATRASDTETWTLNGWYTSSNGGTKVGDANNTVSNINSNRTYYAQWIDNQITLADAEKKITVTYNGNAGTTTKGSDTQKTEFTGWYTASTGGTRVGTAGDKYTVNNNHTLYAHFGNATFVLPDASKDDYVFLGWFSKPQTNDVYTNNVGDIKYYGKAGTKIQVDSSRVLYAWYNSKPVFSDTDVSGAFYEGQTVTGKDLLKLVTVTDKETESAGQKLEINLVDVKYLDGTKVPFTENTILDTKSVNIGNFAVTYTVTDYGITVNGSQIDSSPVTVQYTRICEIRYNDLPSLSVEPYIYTYTGDTSLTEDTIEDFVKGYVTASDRQDDINNLPWWTGSFTHNSLQNNIEIVGVTDIQLSSAYLKDNPEFAETIKSINSLKGIYSLKRTAPEEFNAITSYNIVFDVKDQFGKYASGKLSSYALSKGVEPSERDVTQTDKDRSILVICTKDSSYNNAYNGVRYVSSKYLDTVNTNSYWGDYGRDELHSILALRENKDNVEAESSQATFRKKNGDNLSITINDYTK